MATSGSVNFTLTARQIYEEAMRNIGALGDNDALTATELVICRRTLNMMLKAWGKNKEIGFWMTDTIRLYLTTEQESYQLGPSGNRATTDPYSTTLSAAGEEADNTISVSSTDNMADDQYIGIVLDDNTIQWTTISSYDSDTGVVTLAAALTGDAASGNTVHFFTSLINRPVNVIDVRYVNSSGDETKMTRISGDEYIGLSSKDTTGCASQYYYEPQLTNGVLYVYPTCDDERAYLEVRIRAELDDIDTVTNNAQFPSEWLLAITQNLAVLLAPKMQVSVSRDLRFDAERSLTEAILADCEIGSIYFQPDMG